MRLQSGVGKRVRVSGNGVILALLWLAIVATSAAGQGNSGVRTVSTWQREVERLTRELLQQRQMELRFQRMLDDLVIDLRSAAGDTLRARLAQTRFVSEQLRKTGTAQIQLRASLESLCVTVRKPEGWLGIVTTGISTYDMRSDGHTVVRFLEQPVIASVDPGSPADRVGLRAGDVLLAIGEQPLMHRDVVFADLLRPGERVNVEVQRNGEVVVVRPVVEAGPPALNRTPCSWVDASMAYALGPMSAMSDGLRGESLADDSIRISIRRSGLAGDTGVAGVQVPVAGVWERGFVGPMAQFFTGGANPVAGVQVVPITRDLGRITGATSGLFVVQVLQGTPGREAGLRGGDVILSADGVELESTGTLQRVISRSDTRAVQLVVLRDRKKEKLTIRW